jgi:hypothetical protein
MLQGRLTKRNLFMAGKLTFAPNLYLGESIASEKLDKLKKRLEKKPLLANVYLITPAKNPADQLIQEEVAYYKDIYEEQGISGLLEHL